LIHVSRTYTTVITMLYFDYFGTMERINRIKEILVIQGKTQVWLAEKIGKSTTAVAAMCNNKTQPHLKDLRKIAFILDIDVRELLVSTK